MTGKLHRVDLQFGLEPNAQPLATHVGHLHDTKAGPVSITSPSRQYIPCITIYRSIAGLWVASLKGYNHYTGCNDAITICRDSNLDKVEEVVLHVAGLLNFRNDQIVRESVEPA